jgi:ribosomal-protein-alanine N-acetyltransferase
MKKEKPPAPWLETLRLELRVVVPGDFHDLFRLDSDPRVMKYIADGKPATRDAVAQRLKRFIRYPALYPDLGVWRTARRDTGAFIGWFALNYAGKSTDIEVGYRLLPEAWGQGYATEGAKALVDYGFDDLDLDRIIGLTHPGNKASQRVLMKAGLEDVGWGRYYDRRLRLFAADNPYR